MKLRRQFLIGLIAGLSVFPTLAQEYPTELIRLKVRPGAKGVKFAVRVDNTIPSFKVWYNDGNTDPTVIPNQQVAEGEHQAVNYTFTNVNADGEREIAIEADKVITFRLITGNTVNNGIYDLTELKSSSLRNIFAEFTDLSGKTIDATGLPNLESLLLNDTGIAEIKLPQRSKIKNIAVSPAMVASHFLERINLNDAPALESLLIPRSLLDTIDLTNNPALRTLNISSGEFKIGRTRYGVRAITGAKDLRLDRFIGHSNSLGPDQLPDLSSAATLESTYYGQLNYHLNPNKINGREIDLSHLRRITGIGTAERNSVITWEMARVKEENGQTIYDLSATRAYQFDPIPAEMIQVNARGVYTLDESLLVVDGKRRVRFSIEHEGYPQIGRRVGITNPATYNNKLFSLSVEISNTPNITAIEEIKRSSRRLVTANASGIEFVTDLSGEASIFALDGRLVYRGRSEGTVSLAKGIYIVRVGQEVEKVLL